MEIDSKRFPEENWTTEKKVVTCMYHTQCTATDDYCNFYHTSGESTKAHQNVRNS
jgi:hypothetical protein